MITDAFRKWIAAQSAKLDALHKFDSTRETLFARMTKLTEEVGELADALLAVHSFQRKEKAENSGADALAQECADVVITTLLIAEKAGVDMDAALKNKIAKIDERFEKIARGE